MADGRTSRKGEGDGSKQEQQTDTPDPRATTETNREDGRYEVDYLVRNAVSLLGSRPALVAGALARSRRQTHSLEQAQQLLADHLEAEHDPNEGVA